MGKLPKHTYLGRFQSDSREPRMFRHAGLIYVYSGVQLLRGQIEGQVRNLE